MLCTSCERGRWNGLRQRASFHVRSRLKVVLGPAARKLSRSLSKNLNANLALTVYTHTFSVPAGSLSVGTKQWLWISFGVRQRHPRRRGPLSACHGCAPSRQRVRCMVSPDRLSGSGYKQA